MSSLFGGGSGGLSPLGVEMVVGAFDDFIKKQKAANKAVGNTSKGLKDVEKTSKKAEGSFGKLAKQVAVVAGGFLAAQAVIRGVRAVLVGTIGAAIQFESSFAGVRKTVDASESELKALSSTIRRMALDIPLSTNALNQLAETAGQLGIRGTSNVASFVEVIAKLGATTNLVGAEGATVLARFMNIMGTAQGRVKELAGILVDLGNNSATTEAEIAQMALRIAGTGAVVGLTEAEVLGLAAALSSLGLAADAGGSAISRTLAIVAKSVKSGSEELVVFAQTAGVSIEEFRELFERDAIAGLEAFILGLARVDDAGGNVFATLEALGLADRRVERTLLAAAKGADTFSGAISLAQKAAEEGGAALDTEFNKRMETTAARAELARNAISEIGIEIGTNFLAAISGAADALANIAREAATSRERIDLLTASYLEAAEAAGILKDAQDDSTPSILDQRIALVEAFDALADYERQIIATRVSQGKYGVALGDTEREVRDFRQAVFEATGVLLTGEEALAAVEFELRVLIAREIEASQATSELQDATEEQTEAAALQAQEYKPLTDQIAEMIVANRDLDRGMGPVTANMDAVTEEAEDLTSAISAARSALEKLGIEGDAVTQALLLLVGEGFDPIEEALDIVEAGLIAAGVQGNDLITILALLRGEMRRDARQAEILADRLARVARFAGGAKVSGKRRPGDEGRTRIEIAQDVFGGRDDDTTGAGPTGLTDEEIAAAQAQFEQWAPLFEEVLRTQEDLDEALAEDFGLRTKIADLEGERLAITEQIRDLNDDDSDFSQEILALEEQREGINEQIVALKSRESDFNRRILELEEQREDIADRIFEIRNAEFETEQALLDVQERRRDILREISDLSAPDVAEVERITDRERLLNIARSELELAALQAEERGENTDELEDQITALAEQQALERETLGVEKTLARLRIDSIEDAREEELATVAAQAEARAAAFDAEREARQEEISGLQEQSRLIGERIETEREDRDAAIDALAAQRDLLTEGIEIQEEGRKAAIEALVEEQELLDERIKVAEEALEKELDRREDILQAAKDLLAEEEALSELIATREEKSIENLKTMKRLQEELNRLRDQEVGTVVAIPPRAMAEGGPFAAGEVLQVGEKGTELAVFGRGGTIISSAMLSGMVSAVQGLTRAAAGMAAMPGGGGTQIVPIPIEKTVMNLNATYSNPQPEASLFRDMTTMQTLRRGR